MLRAATCLVTSSSQLQHALLSRGRTVALCITLRHGSFRGYVNLEDPEETLVHVKEVLRRLASEHKEGTSAYIHARVNLAIAQLQRRDFISARNIAVSVHNDTKAKKGAHGSIIYFTATTASRCCHALADSYEAHLREMEELSHCPDAVKPSAAQGVRSSLVIEKLRRDAKAYEDEANRCYNAADHGFMRGYDTEHRRTGWDDSSSSSEFNNGSEDQWGNRWQEKRKRNYAQEARSQRKNASSVNVPR